MRICSGLHALICGGNWNNGVNCGPRTVNGNNYPWNVNTNIGSRFACDLTRSINKILACVFTDRKLWLLRMKLESD